MLIGLCGLRSAGKREVAQFLVAEHGFIVLESPSLFFEGSPGILMNGDAAISKGGNGSISTLPSRQLLSQCWKPNINVVIRDIRPHDPLLYDLLKRPYFLLVFVDAPFVIRFKRSVANGRCDPTDWEKFADLDDAERYGLPVREDPDIESCCNREADRNLCGTGRCRYSLSGLEQVSRLRIHNNSASLSELHEQLRTTNFTDPERLRPSWDTYFMSLAKLAAERTNCMKRRVGCVIARNKRVVATGYNGTPSGVKNCMDGGCGRCNGTNSNQGVGLDLCLCLHAEENAIIEAGRERCEGSTLYTNLFPCILCSKKIVQSGIARIVFEKHYATDAAAETLLRAGNVIVDLFRREDLLSMLEGGVLHGSVR